MEREAFVKTMDKLLTEIKLTEICTDAHTQISSLMNPNSGHSRDMWHVAKNLAKKITTAGQLSGQKILLKWTKDIVNHFWYCCKTAETDGHFRIYLSAGVLSQPHPDVCK